MDIIDIEMPLYAHNNIMYIYYELHGYKWHYIDIMTLLHLAPHTPFSSKYHSQAFIVIKITRQLYWL